MNFVNNLKAGAKLAPAFLIGLYLLFVFLDIVTTYLVTPDLKMESNYLFKLLEVNWFQLILIYLIAVFFVLAGLFIGENYLYNHYSGYNTKPKIQLFKEVFSNTRLLLSMLFLSVFYSHIINIGFVIINNVLGIIYLSNQDGNLSIIAYKYILKQNIFRIYYQSAPILLGFLIAYFKISKIRNKHFSLNQPF